MAANKSSFQGRLALITGGSSGIGLALARLLAQEGANVWLMARRKEALDRAAKELAAADGQKHGVVAGDVSDWEQVQAAAQHVTHEAGLPDLLINSAGITHPGLVHELAIGIYRELMDVNYLGTVRMVKALLPDMLKRGSGHIVNISSSAGFVTGPGYGAYSASKYAVRAFSDVLRAELKPRGLRVSLVYPPNTDTPQRAYELSLQTPDVRHLDESASIGPWKFDTLPASEVADVILKGVQRGSYVILPGTGNRVLYRLVGLLGNLIYSIVDDEWAAARQKSGKK
jgi:3-dehydrosphinganine reductase